MNQKYQQILSARPVPRKIRDNILVGLVETGFTPEYVILTLEQPSKKNSVNDTVEWNYEDRKIIFQDNKVLQVILPKIE